MKIFYYDLETTGVFHWKNGIHQISIIIEIDGDIKERLDLKVRPNPAAKIEKEALDIAGVTLEQVLSYPPMEDIYHKIISILGKYVNRFDRTDKFHLCGFNNANFDNNFFRAFFVQNGDNYFGSWFWADSIDVMVLASSIFKSHRKKMANFKLMTVAKHFGIKVEESKLHDAMYDVELTYFIHKKIERGETTFIN